MKDQQIGIRIEKTVPDRHGTVQLRTRIDQPFFLTISALTHKPRPVPVSPFVVTNGSKIV
jgi:hypothetical protein